MLTREQILAADDLPRVKVEVPEWGGEVYVQTLTASEREEWEVSADSVGDVKALRLIRASMVCLTACDEHGVRLFAPEDIPALAKKSASAVMRVFDASQKLNRVSKEDVDALEKNSETSPSDSSASDSPES